MPRCRIRLYEIKGGRPRRPAVRPSTSGPGTAVGPAWPTQPGDVVPNHGAIRIRTAFSPPLHRTDPVSCDRSALRSGVMSWTPDEIRAARVTAGWSQKDFAEHVGASLRTVGQWERGQACPSPLNLGQLDALFGPSPSAARSAPTPPLLKDASNAELIAELARRLAPLPD